MCSSDSVENPLGMMAIRGIRLHDEQGVLDLQSRPARNLTRMKRRCSRADEVCEAEEHRSTRRVSVQRVST